MIDYSYTIDGVQITFHDIIDGTRQEAENYLDFVRKRTPLNVKSITVTACPDGLVDVTFTAHGDKFERIRRITGYLVGTIDRWNDSKQAEEHDRVKHDTRFLA